MSRSYSFLNPCAQVMRRNELSVVEVSTGEGAAQKSCAHTLQQEAVSEGEV